MGLGRLSYGEKISGVSAVLLFVFMFFHWFGVEAVNNTGLLFDIRGGLPGKSVWEALDYTPIVLVVTVAATLSVAALRLTNVVHRPLTPVNVVVTILGLVSMVLIFLPVLDPPNFGTVGLITYEGTVQLPIFLALLAAAGIAFGGCLALCEERFFLGDRRARRDGTHR